MKDVHGYNIKTGSILRCIDDVDYGKEYKVESVYGVLCIRDKKTNIPIELGNFEQSNHKLTNFEIVEEFRKNTKNKNRRFYVTIEKTRKIVRDFYGSKNVCSVDKSINKDYYVIVSMMDGRIIKLTKNEIKNMMK